MCLIICKILIGTVIIVFFRMIGLTVGFDKKDMMDIRYRRVRDGWVADLVLQEMYICASVEFLLTVANVFLEAYTTGTAVETSVQTWTAKEEG